MPGQMQHNAIKRPYAHPEWNLFAMRSVNQRGHVPNVTCRCNRDDRQTYGDDNARRTRHEQRFFTWPCNTDGNHISRHGIGSGRVIVCRLNLKALPVLFLPDSKAQRQSGRVYPPTLRPD